MTENPYATPAAAAEERSPQEMADEIRAIAFYTRWVLFLIPVQIIVPTGGMLLQSLGYTPANDEVLGFALKLLLFGYVLLFGFMTFQLSRVVFRPPLGPSFVLLLALLSMCFPLGFLVALLPILRAPGRLSAWNIPFGWFGPNGEEVEAGIAEWMAKGAPESDASAAPVANDSSAAP